MELSARSCLAVLWALFTVSAVHGQDKEQEVDHSYKPLTLKLDKSGKKYIRFITWQQFWAKSTENNPGTVDVEGNPMDNSLDFGLRRSRFLFYAQISPRYLILTHFGINNQTFTNGGAPGLGPKKPQLFMHDVWNEFMLEQDKLYIGAGLHYWHGVSRLTNGSTLNFMTIDAPILNWPNIEATDQFARQFGIYAKGQLGKWDYRVAVNKPFSTGPVATDENLTSTAVNVQNQKAAFQGYFFYQFKDKESNKLPYMVGSYLGEKDVFNIGAGFHSHADATANLENGQVASHDILQLGFDIFYDRPLNKGKGTAISLYSVFYHYDFGPDYLRNIGIMNIGQGGTSLAGRGNAQPLIGTGNIWYTQLGYQLPKLGDGSAFMPYVTFTYKDFEALQESSSQFDLGMNYFINGHHAKITLQYSNRPIYELDGTRDGSAGEFILQTHIFL